MSLMVHRPVSGFDIICNNLNPPLTNIVRFGPLHIVISLTVLKTYLTLCSRLQLSWNLTDFQPFNRLGREDIGAALSSLYGALLIDINKVFGAL